MTEKLRQPDSQGDARPLLPAGSAGYRTPLRRPAVGGPCRLAFTLMELVVAVAVLALMMTMAGSVFKLTLDSTGQATALIEVSQSLQVLEQNLRQDLRETPRQGSILVIQSNTINAFWTETDREANVANTNPDPAVGRYTHNPDPEREDAAGNMLQPRADVLMTFTSR
ncbi:MAG: prepilin-type N-terminal cleavage/methylation domain-containing protein, partial [bacterium]|nr:prepilin-type N-terminal cleavage/methylation domain-containing protein [bacterium]